MAARARIPRSLRPSLSIGIGKAYKWLFEFVLEPQWLSKWLLVLASTPQGRSLWLLELGLEAQGRSKVAIKMAARMCCALFACSVHHFALLNFASCTDMRWGALMYIYIYIYIYKYIYIYIYVFINIYKRCVNLCIYFYIFRPLFLPFFSTFVSLCALRATLHSHKSHKMAKCVSQSADQCILLLKSQATSYLWMASVCAMNLFRASRKLENASLEWNPTF